LQHFQNDLHVFRDDTKDKWREIYNGDGGKGRGGKKIIYMLQIK